MQSYADARFRCFGFDADMDMDMVPQDVVKSKSGSDSPIANSAGQQPKTPVPGDDGGDDVLPNEISAPYEVPQFPIEQIEKKLQIQRQLNVRVMNDRYSTLGDSCDDVLTVPADHELVPNFQRVSISGEDTSGVPLEDLERASTLLIQALEMRSRYMSLSEQSFPTTTLRFLKTVHESDRFNKIKYEDRKSIAELIRKISLPSIHPQGGSKKSFKDRMYTIFL